MAIEIRSIEVVDGSATQNQDRVVVGVLNQVANLVGGGAGAAVTTAVTLKGLPANYNVFVTPSQAAMVSITGKTRDGFNVVLTPLGTVTLSAGTFDVLVVA